MIPVSSYNTPTYKAAATAAQAPLLMVINKCAHARSNNINTRTKHNHQNTRSRIIIIIINNFCCCSLVYKITIIITIFSSQQQNGSLFIFYYILLHRIIFFFNYYFFTHVIYISLQRSNITKWNLHFTSCLFVFTISF